MRECMTETMYEKLGISKEVYEFGPVSYTHLRAHET